MVPKIFYLQEKYEIRMKGHAQSNLHSQLRNFEEALLEVGGIINPAACR